MARIAFWTPLIAIAMLLCNPSPAAAQQLTLYSDSTAFAQAVGAPLSPVDFEDLNSLDNFATLTYGGATFLSETDDPSALLALSPDTFPPLPSAVVLANVFSGPEPDAMIVELSPGVTAVGLDVMSIAPGFPLSPAGSSIDLTVEGTDGAQIYSIPLAEGAPTFIGLTATEGTISRVTLANPAGQERFVAIDNVLFGDVVPPSDPLLDALDSLADAIADGREAGAIRKLGTSLEDKVARARAAAEVGDADGVREALKGLANQVRAQRGKFITLAAADILLARIADCLAALE